MAVSNAPFSLRSLSLDHQGLSQMLIERENILIIQDLDGVCMGLVKDPLTRVIEARYLRAAKAFGDHFYVLTNGEHIGLRGVNGIVERTFADEQLVKEHGLYLQGLAAGGVQWQDSHGNVFHPGVSDAEMAFLEALPDKIITHLREWGQQPKYGLDPKQLEEYIQATVLDNKVSPTANLNVFHEVFSDRPEFYAELQQEMKMLSDRLLEEARQQGLADSFFVHYAPNLGRDEQGLEIMQPATGKDSGTTDFQFMLRGGIKEVGVIVILNHYYYLQTGKYPLGKDFNARQAPKKHQELLQLVEDNFDPAIMPTIVGIGDTVTSKAVKNGDRLEFKRGGSDRGFLELVQALGKKFATDNVVVYIDSSGGEVKNRQALKLDRTNPQQVRVIQGPGDVRDTQDPLTLNVVFPGGYEQYVDFFCHTVTARKSTRSTHPTHK
ncbi:glucosylglycerol 3-phosphatase [Pleurocapsales cyanobacterium LEGE 10410]|nr:glucosylglycerol 3-phosphatase [Pleurocapsales cyanobacterium LEGE 10410]